jgi:hypothetical protein
MSVRLYPADETHVEALAGVPVGTAARLKAFEAQQETMGEDVWYDKLLEDEQLNTLHNFSLYGWGRLNVNAYYYLQRKGLDPICGEVTGEDARKVLELQGVALPEGVAVNEVCWS